MGIAPSSSQPTHPSHSAPPAPPPTIVTYPTSSAPPPVSNTRRGGLKGIGVTEIIFGVLSFICSAAASGVAKSIPATGIFQASPGCWCGALLFISGCVAISASNSGNFNNSMTIAVFAWAACAASLGVSAATAYYSFLIYQRLESFVATLLIITGALNGLVAIFSMVGLFITILQFRFSRQTPQHQTVVMTTVAGQQQPPGQVYVSNQQQSYPSVQVNYPTTAQQPGAIAAPPSYDNVMQSNETKTAPPNQGVFNTNYAN